MAQVLNNYSSNGSVASYSSSISDNIAQYRNAWGKDKMAASNLANQLAIELRQKGYKPEPDKGFLSPTDILNLTQKFPDQMNNWLKSVEAQESFSSNDSAATESISDQSDNQTQSTQKSFKESVTGLSNVLQASKQQVVPAAVLQQSLNDIVNSVEPEEKQLATKKANEIFNAAVIEKDDLKVAALGRSLLDLDPANMREGPEVSGLPPVAPLGILASEAQDRQSFVPLNNKISSSASVGIPTRISSNSSTVTAPSKFNLPATRSVNLNLPKRAPVNRFRSSNSVFTTDESEAAPSLNNQLNNLFASGSSVYSTNSRKLGPNNSVTSRGDRSIAQESSRNRINLLQNQLNDLAEDPDDASSVISSGTRRTNTSWKSKASAYLNEDDTGSVSTRHTTTPWEDDNKSQASSTLTLPLARARREMLDKAADAELAAKAFEKSQKEVEELKRQLAWAEKELDKKDAQIEGLGGEIKELKFDTKDLEDQYNAALLMRDQQEDLLRQELDGVFAALQQAQNDAFAQSNEINAQIEFKDKLTGMLKERTIEATKLQDDLQTAIDELKVSKGNYSALVEEVKRMEAQHANTLDRINKEVELKYITREEANLAQARAEEQLDQYKLNLTNLTAQYNMLKAQLEANKDQKSTELDLLKEQVLTLEAEQKRIVTAYKTNLLLELEKQKKRIESAWEPEKQRLSHEIDRLTREKNTAVLEKADVATKSEKLQRQLTEKLKRERKLREDSDNKLASLELEMVELANKEKKALLKIASLEKRPPPPNNNQQDREAEIQELQQEIKDHQSKYDNLELLYKKEREALAAHTGEEARLYNTVQELEEKLQDFEEANITVQGFRALQHKTENNQVDITTLQRKLKESKESIFEKDQQITQLQEALVEARRAKPSRPLNNNSFIDYKSQLDLKTRELEDLHAKYLALLRAPPVSRRQKPAAVVADDTLLVEAQAKIDQLRKDVASLEGDLVVVNSALKMRDSTILTLNATMDAERNQTQSSVDQALRVLQDQLNAKNVEIQQLAQEIRNKDILLASAGSGGDDEKKYNGNNNYQQLQEALKTAEDQTDLWKRNSHLAFAEANRLKQELKLLKDQLQGNDLAQQIIQLTQRIQRLGDDNQNLREQLQSASGSSPPPPHNNNNNQQYSELVARYNQVVDENDRLVDNLQKLEARLLSQQKPKISFNMATGSSSSHAVERFLAVVASVY